MLIIIILFQFNIACNPLNRVYIRKTFLMAVYPSTEFVAAVCHTASSTWVNDLNARPTTALWREFLYCLELKRSQCFWYPLYECNARQRPWNQQVFGVVFNNASPAARSWRWSSLFTTAAACDGYLSFIFRRTHTHTHIYTHSCNSHTSSFAHLHTFVHLNPPPRLLSDYTTSSLTSSRSTPLSVLQREALLWATQRCSLTF